MLYALRHNPNFTPSQLIGKVVPNFDIPKMLVNNQASNALVKHPNKALDILNQPRWYLVNFWSTNCYICRDEAEFWAKFYNTVTQVNMTNPEIVSVNIGDAQQDIVTWQKNYGQNFPVIMDKDGLISLNFGVTGTPETFLVAPDKIVRYRIAGAVNKQTLLSLIDWLDQHPQATESDIREALYQN